MEYQQERMGTLDEYIPRLENIGLKDNISDVISCKGWTWNYLHSTLLREV